MDFLVIIFLIIAAISWVNKNNKKAKAEAERRQRAAQQADQAGGYKAPARQAYDPRFPDYDTPVPEKKPSLTGDLFERAQRAITILIDEDTPLPGPAAGTQDTRFPAYTPAEPVLEGREGMHTTGRSAMSPSMSGPVGGTFSGTHSMSGPVGGTFSGVHSMSGPVSGTVTAPSYSGTVAAPTFSGTAAPSHTKRARHDLTPSYYGGHAHVENSMGSMDEGYCPPGAASSASARRTDAAGIRRAALASIPGGDPLVQGIILGEILGKPRALRARR